ncbi:MULTISPECIES: M23 family metallopeptidase [unclassified Pseudonocardia]|uniref:M23 family metallopeptidase n=1 Tax=unclassified Pseudonocardia TaxID=2619320 RepID=UPI000966183E|nr:MULTISPECIES: M23 family metallopeptidase [unclassified Pseudonocardia]OJY54433.1 MAG: hypothetical protein BGP03_23155 [Pseudonocardia sp. 73-21]
MSGRRGRRTLSALAGGATLAAGLSPTVQDDRTVVHVAYDAVTTGHSTGLSAIRIPGEPAVLIQPVVLAPAGPTVDGSALAKAAQLAERRAVESRIPRTVRPVAGIITSNFGARWGTTHYGLDIANSVGTPIRSVADGVVIDAGPASGFGLWVRVRLEDGTTTVYGHINRYLVRTGQRVRAGQVIAEVGNRGISTGPHLHFEVIDARGNRLDPLAWLNARGAGYA